jgi:hypothetical protein
MAQPSLGDYIKRVGGSFGALSSLGAVLPIASFWPADWAAYLFPPLGDLTPIARVLCVIAVLVVIGGGYVGVGLAGLKKWIVLGAILTLIGASAHIYYSLQYVLKINTPDSFYLVSVGSDRTDFANHTFAKDESPWNMVKQRGLSDEDITKIWTRESVRNNRLKLFFSYLMTAVFWASVFALATALEINSGVKGHHHTKV